jgi:hypothetical protein
VRSGGGATAIPGDVYGSCSVARGAQEIDNPLEGIQIDSMQELLEGLKIASRKLFNFAYDVFLHRFKLSFFLLLAAGFGPYLPRLRRCANAGFVAAPGVKIVTAALLSDNRT